MRIQEKEMLRLSSDEHSVRRRRKWQVLLSPKLFYIPATILAPPPAQIMWETR